MLIHSKQKQSQNLLVRWKLLQMLFYCFSCSLTGSLNHLKSRMKYGFSDIFSCHICFTVAETIGVINYATSFGAKKCSHLKLLKWCSVRGTSKNCGLPFLRKTTRWVSGFQPQVKVARRMHQSWERKRIIIHFIQVKSNEAVFTFYKPDARAVLWNTKPKMLK